MIHTSPLFFAVPLAFMVGCSSEAASENIASDESDLSSAAVPAGTYRNLDPAAQRTTETVYFSITLASDGTYTAERGRGVVCTHCSAQHWPEEGSYKTVTSSTGGSALELRPKELPPGNYLLPRVSREVNQFKLYQPGLGIFQLTMGAAGPPQPTLPNGKAQLLGAGMRGDPFDASKPWTPIGGGCLLNLTIAGGPTPTGDRYTIQYLVPRTSPTVSGRVTAVGQNGSVVGTDNVNPGVVVQRSWNRTLSLALQPDKKVAWSLTNREETTSTVGGPAGGIGGTRTVLYKCSGVADASVFQ